MKYGVGGLLMAGALAMSFGTAARAEPMTLTSPQYADGAVLAVKNGGSQALPSCAGDNVSPPLSWSNVPEGTKSFALMMLDPEGGGGAGFSHMVIYGIPAAVTGFAEGALGRPSAEFVGGKNALGMAAYFGPCPPVPFGWHHYVLTLIATDLDPKALPPGMTRDELLAATKGHAKAVAGLVFRFRHP